MAAIATIDIGGAIVSTIEIEHPDRPYTYETIETLRSFYGEQARLFFVVGSDSFEDLHRWREPMRVLSESNLIVAARPGYQMVNPALLEIATGKGAASGPSETQTQTRTTQTAVRIVDLRGDAAAARLDFDSLENSIYLTDFVQLDISSTDIRQKISQGLPIADFVPAPVAGYIAKYGLYRKGRIESGH